MSNDELEYQQGDVLAYRVKELPKGIKPINGVTVAFGEKTGHNHTFYDDDICAAEKFDHRTDKGSKNVELFEDEMKNIYANILAPVFLRHQEHKPIKFEPGIYRIGIVREYDHIEKLSRRVVD